MWRSIDNWGNCASTCPNFQAGSNARRPTVIHDGFVAIEGLTLPVLTDLAEQWVFDRIPPGRARTIDSVNDLFF